MSFFDKIKKGLKKTLDNVAFALSSDKLGEDYYELLLEKLILSDTGYELAEEIVEKLREKVKEFHISDADAANEKLIEIVSEMLKAESPLDFDSKPVVILMIGVNGAGKTTTAGKIADLLVKRGNKVILAAADTFRAAAREQLEVWANRSGADFIAGANDPSAVIYDAVRHAVNSKADFVICDTAGRLHTKKNLMDELAKMTRTAKKASPESSIETLLVIDAITGQNAINQAAQFAVDTGVSGIVLTKLDGTAKGGSTIAIKHKLGIPLRFIGVGEGIEDLLEFNAEDFARAFFL
ncbi:MAG: signal recognition particle-docking protein FtsY [Ruminococcaceae bacterium]|nr:signal recognition particle-docking protein FtsY [Oscillospiraceae bacterium]